MKDKNRLPPKRGAEDTEERVDSGGPSNRPATRSNPLVNVQASGNNLRGRAILSQFNEIKHAHFTADSFSALPPAQRNRLLTEHIEKLKLSAFAEVQPNKDSLVWQGLNHYVPLECASFAESKSGKNLEDFVIGEFLQPKSKAKIFLAKGNSGAGKSLFGRYIEKQLWDKYGAVNYIPLFISLPLLQSKDQQSLKGRLLEFVLQEKGMPDALIAHIKQAKLPIFLILDGYDEIGINSNLFNDNHLNDWNVKVMITCRAQHLTGNYQRQFAQISANHTLIIDSLIERHLVAFNESKIKQFIQQFVSEPSEYPAWNAEQYMAKISTIQNWQDLVKEPFILQALLTILPGLDKTTDPQAFTKASIYEVFTKQWFEKEYNRLGPELSKYITTMKLQQLDVLDIFAEFAEELAYRMLTTNKQIAIRPEERLRRRNREEQGEWDDFFINENEEKRNELRIGLEGSPLKHIGENRYSFIHRSFYEFFVAKLFLRDLLRQKEEQRYQLLNSTLLTREPEIIQFIAEYLGNGQKRYGPLEATFFNIIERSKTDPKLRMQNSYAAANAITILNYANVSFAGRNFRGVCIRGADLSRANLDQTDFSNADLQNAILVQSWMHKTIFDKSNLLGAKFGEYPSIKAIADASYMTITPDGRRILSGNSIGEVITLDAEDGAEVSRLINDKDAVSKSSERFLAITSDDKYLISVSADTKGVVSIWDRSKKKCLHKISTGYVLSCFDVSDSNRLIICTVNKEIIIINLQSFSSKTIIVENCEEISCIAASDSEIALGFYSGLIRVLSIDTKKEAKRLTQKGSVSCLVATSNKQKLISGSSDGTIIVWDMTTLMPILTLQGSKSTIKRIITTFDEKRIIAAGWDNIVRIWDMESGQAIRVIRSHEQDIVGMALHPVGSKLFLSHKNSITVWDMDIVRTKLSSTEIGEAISSMALSFDKTRLIVASGKTIRIHNAQTSKLIAVLEMQSDATSCLASIPNSDGFVSSGWDGNIKVWDKNGKFLYNLEGHASNVSCLAVSKDGSYLVSGSYDGTIKVWNIAERKLLRTMEKSHDEYTRILCLSLTQDGTKVIANYAKDIGLWDLGTGRLEMSFRTSEADEASCIMQSDVDKDLFFSVYGSNHHGSLPGAPFVWNNSTSSPPKQLALAYLLHTKCAIIIPETRSIVSASGIYSNIFILIDYNKADSRPVSIRVPSEVNSLQVVACKDGSYLLYSGHENSMVNCWSINAMRDAAILLWSMSNGALWLSNVSCKETVMSENNKRIFSHFGIDVSKITLEQSHGTAGGLEVTATSNPSSSPTKAQTLTPASASRGSEVDTFF